MRTRDHKPCCCYVVQSSYNNSLCHEAAKTHQNKPFLSLVSVSIPSFSSRLDGQSRDICAAWAVDLLHHMLRKGSYKGAAKRTPCKLKLPFDGMTAPAAIFTAANLQILQKTPTHEDPLNVLSYPRLHMFCRLGAARYPCNSRRWRCWMSCCNRSGQRTWSLFCSLV